MEGQTTAFFKVPIVDDNLIESTETFSVSLTTSDSDVVLFDATTTVSILDNDGEQIY